MDYARDHIKRYWIFSYRRALGISMVTFAMALAVGMVFTSLISASPYANPVVEFAFWMLLILITSLTLVFSFMNAHASSIKFMTREEHMTHSKYTGIWLASIVLGALIFIFPIFFVTNAIEPLIFLFSFGGILLVMYLSVGLIFKHTYTELAFGAAALWIIFIVSIVATTEGAATLNVPTSAYLSVNLFISISSLIVVFAFIGLMMLFNSTKEFVTDFEKFALDIEKGIKYEVREAEGKGHAPIHRVSHGKASRRKTSRKRA
ncbi:hypothetical protein M1439_00245 [Candidatus Marsarchaeota archaeon]|nr:hypothetical protein [Candidatus Marsarchaeota archaeon]